MVKPHFIAVKSVSRHAKLDDQQIKYIMNNIGSSDQYQYGIPVDLHVYQNILPS